ncbi:MAG: DUF3165 family protein [Streptococcus salivarius]
MFYLIVAVLIASFYFLLHQVGKNTESSRHGYSALSLLAVLSIIKFFSLPGEFFVTVGMFIELSP